MATYQLEVDEDAYAIYHVEANSEEEAREIFYDENRNKQLLQLVETGVADGRLALVKKIKQGGETGID